LNDIADLGFTAVWLMGIWAISKGAKAISRIVAHDFEGSPYAIPTYKVNPELGGKKAFTSFVERAHAANLKVIVDFVSNHMAIDSPWINKDPELFIGSNTRARKQQTGEYFLHKSGEVIAFGRDPYFPPWHDTSQLDYANSKLRDRMIRTLKKLARLADGVRCDMAMLVLRDYIREQWYPYASADWFDEHMPSEFWGEAIHEVKHERPDFVFIAETYWDKEPKLLSLGFDLVYEKKLYDALVVHNAALVTGRLLRSHTAMQQSVYFIENHDEPRAAAVFDRDYNLTAAALILSLPGSMLIHEGQQEGWREKLPVQRLRPLTEEQDDLELQAAYQQLLKITKDEVFNIGEFQLFETNVYGVVAFMRRTANRVVAYIGQIADAWHLFSHTALNITALALAVEAEGQLRVTNLFNSNSKILQTSNDEFHLQLSELGVKESTRFCLLEVMKF
jgi:glycosidase